MSKFTCGVCGGEFEDSWTEEEANAEASELWGIEKASESSDMTVVCDDCYQMLLTHTPPEQMELGRDLLKAKNAMRPAPVDVTSQIAEGDLRYPFWPIAAIMDGEERVVMDWIDGVITLQSFEEASETFSADGARHFAGRILLGQEDYNTQCIDLRDGLIMEGKIDFVRARGTLTITAGRGVINDYVTSPIDVGT
jgi:hypothetical protein